MKYKVVTLLLAGCLLFGTVACRGTMEEETLPNLVEEEETAAYITVAAGYGDVVKTAKVRSNYVSLEKYNLAFAVDNKLIKEVNAKIGEYVEAGQLLVALDVEDLEAEIAQLEFQIGQLNLQKSQTEEMQAFDLASADRMYAYTEQKKADREALQKNKERITEQYRRSIESLSDQIALQQLKLEQDRQEFENGLLYAGISGEITYVQNDMKDTPCKKDRVVVTISDRDACYFVSDDIEYAEYFKEEEPVELSYRENGKKIDVQVVPALMDQWEEQMYFQVLSDELVSNKASGIILMELDSREHVLCVPADAVHESDKGLFVYLEKNGLLEMRYVTVGLAGDTLMEITDGLAEGEMVALKN